MKRTRQTTTSPCPDFITTVVVEIGPAHETVTVFNRGALAGTLVVAVGDGLRLAERLIPEGTWQ